MELELEEVIEHLTERNRMKIKDIWERLNLERSSFQSWRRSSFPSKRAELAEAIMKAFPGEFQEEDVAKIKVKGSTNMEKKIVALMEKTIDELRADRDRLKEENENRLREIERTIREIRDKLLK